MKESPFGADDEGGKVGDVAWFTDARDLLRGDLGTSMRTGQPVLEEIMQRFPSTMLLAVSALRAHDQS